MVDTNYRVGSTVGAGINRQGSVSSVKNMFHGCYVKFLKTMRLDFQIRRVDFYQGVLFPEVLETFDFQGLRNHDDVMANTESGSKAVTDKEYENRVGERLLTVLNPTFDERRVSPAFRKRVCNAKKFLEAARLKLEKTPYTVEVQARPSDVNLLIAEVL